MRRVFVLIFLLLVLPFQFSWAAVGSVCAHEHAPEAAHFGHHGHDHGVDHDASNATSADAPLSHGDCDACCHGSIAAPTTIAVLPLQRQSQCSFDLPTRPAKRATEPPYRPDWSGLA